MKVLPVKPYQGCVFPLFNYCNLYLEAVNLVIGKRVLWWSLLVLIIACSFFHL